MIAGAPYINPPGLPAPGLPPTPPTSGPPSPASDPEHWNSIAIASFAPWPPTPLEDGTVRVELEESLKIDQQKASGKDKAKTKVNGVDCTKGKIHLRWTEALWDVTVALLDAVSPNGPNKGGPFTILHPEVQRRRVDQFMVKKHPKLVIEPGGKAYSTEIEIEEWNPPDDDEPGETETPGSAFNWKATSFGGKGTVNPNATSYGGPKGPTAKP